MAIHTAYTSGSGAIPTITCVEDTDIWIPVLLVDATDGITGETGIAYGAMDVDYGLASATSLTSYSVDTNHWKEMGEGLYALKIGASEFSSVGKYFVRIGDTSPAAGKYLVIVDVTSSTVSDIDSVPTYSAKKATDTWIPIMLMSKSDGNTAVTGVAYGSMDVDFAYASATGLTSYTPATADWKEIGEGMYALRIGAAEFPNAGRYFVRAVDTSANANKYFFAVETTDATIDDVAASSLNINDVPTFSAKKATDTWIPVLLVNKSDGITGVTGVAYGSVDVDYQLASATGLTSYSVATADWKEMSEGMYALRIGAAEFPNAGRYFVRVVDTSATSGKFFCSVETTDSTIDDFSVNVGNTIPTFTSKLSTDSWVPVRLTSDTDGVTAITGIVHGAIDVDYGLASATSFTSYTPGSGNWKEMGEGLYALNIGASEFGSAGRYMIRVIDTGATAMKYACVVETHAASQDDLVRATTPGNTLDIDANGLVDVSKFNGTAVSVDGTTNLLKVDVGAISSDATAANTLESVVEGATQLAVDVTKISGDTAAADALELFVETLTSGKLATGSFVANSLNETLFADDCFTNAQFAATAIAEMADAVWDEATSGHTSVGTYGKDFVDKLAAILADTGTDGVKVDLGQVMGETHDDLTVGYALYIIYAHFVHKWTTGTGSSIVHKADNTTFQSRTITSTNEIQKKS